MKIKKTRYTESQIIWIKEYNEERPHDSLGDLTPREYLMANSKRENSKSAWS